MQTHHKEILLNALALAGLLFLLRWLELRLVIIEHSFEIYASAIALIFTLLGIWLAMKITKPRKEIVIVEKEVTYDNFIFNDEECLRRNISKRELEVLSLLADGLSNAEIAERLFVSMNNVKTHVSKLLEKLEVSRRKQAIDKARRLGLISSHPKV